MNNCKECGRKYIYDRSNGSRKTICNSCRTKVKRKKKRDYLLDLAGNKCSKCGYSKCKDALHFHHLRDKEFSISGNYNRKLETLIEEINKCILVCANCHAEIHSSLTQSGQSASLTRKKS